MDETDRSTDSARQFAPFVGAAVAGALLFRWLSAITAGPEYGGRFDLPAVNYLSWFLFCLCVAAAFMGAVGGVLRSLAWVTTRVRDRRTALSRFAARR